VFQAFHVLPHLSVAHNVALPLLLLKTPDDARVARALAAVGLAGFGDRLPQTLSGGQLQRVAIARALVHAPRLILADEPTGNLDAGNAERVMSVLVEQVRVQRMACLLVTHSKAAAARADRVLELRPDGLVAF
jgi:putative ABC transport system ATP-binding protein